MQRYFWKVRSTGRVQISIKLVSFGNETFSDLAGKKRWNLKPSYCRLPEGTCQGIMNLIHYVR